jgi:ribosome-associated protein
MSTIAFELRGEFITLDHLLKVCHLANSGGQAKLMVADGLVEVDGQVELRKTAKIRAGQVVCMGDARIEVTPEGSTGTTDSTQEG